MKNTILVEVATVIPIKNYYLPGVGSATKALISALNEISDIPYNIELYAKGRMALNFDFYGWKFKHHVIPVPTRLLDLNQKIEPFLRSKMCKYDIFHVTNNYFNVGKEESFIATIHDCTDLDKRWSVDVKEEDRKLIISKFQHMASASRIIVTVSNYTKTDIVHYFGVDPDKVIVNHLGIDRHRFHLVSPVEIKTTLSKYKIFTPYFFACSCNRPRKNLVTALRAFKKFLTIDPQHIFVVAWKNPPSEIVNEFAYEINNHKIIFIPFLTERELVVFYNGASLSIYVSRKEGFGLPILESFACGTPVMTCWNSSIPEVGQDAAIYVGEDNIDEMVDVMKMFEKSTFDHCGFIERSEKVLKQFTWHETAKRCLGVYDVALNT